MPIGGEGTHCVISAHRGLPSAKLFTDLDLLVVGDTFSVRSLNEVLTYEVDDIQEVDPGDSSKLTIEEGRDYCTLLTCTPYGINSERLLVRGHRIPTPPEELSDDLLPIVVKYLWMIIAAILAGIIALIVIIIIILIRRKKRKGSPAGKHAR